MKKVILICVLGLTLGLISISFLSNSDAYTRDEIDGFSHQLFEFGSVRYVHALADPLIAANKALFEKVENGTALSIEESCQYRTAYWQILRNKLSHFKAVDGDLYVATDFGMDTENNCLGAGIDSDHDLHDMSAKQNLQALETGITELKQNIGWVRRVIIINGIHKNLVDVLTHMSPATHSIGVNSPNFTIEDASDLEQNYHLMHAAFKKAQFSNINSSEYWDAIDAAVSAYGDMVWQVQTAVSENSSPTQRKIAGRWLALQTLAPRLNLSDCVRPHPPQSMTCG